MDEQKKPLVCVKKGLIELKNMPILIALSKYYSKALITYSCDQAISKIETNPGLELVVSSMITNVKREGLIESTIKSLEEAIEECEGYFKRVEKYKNSLNNIKNQWYKEDDFPGGIIIANYCKERKIKCIVYANIPPSDLYSLNGTIAGILLCSKQGYIPKEDLPNILHLLSNPWNTGLRIYSKDIIRIGIGGHGRIEEWITLFKDFIS